MPNKTYLVVNTSYFGDTLLTSNLVQNIRANEPDAEIIFLANTPFAPVAASLKDVDLVLAYDKKGKNKGLQGIWHFYKEYKDFFAGKNLEAAFIIYGNERGIVLAKLWGAKNIYSANHGILDKLIANHKAMPPAAETKVAKLHALLYDMHNPGKLKNFNMHWTVTGQHRREAQQIIGRELQSTDLKNLVGLCPVSKKIEKDLPLTLAVDVIEALYSRGKKVLLLGAGETAREYLRHLSQLTDKFHSLIDKTSLQQLAGVLDCCDNLISVDTGTMHLGLAVNVPTTCLFFINDPHHIAAWAPEKDQYNCRVLAAPITAKQIIEATVSLHR